jgi:hypothetical protein
MRFRRNAAPLRALRLTPGRRVFVSVAFLLVALLTGAQAADIDSATPLREQAFTCLWNEDAPRAITLFREYLAGPGTESDREARRGLALACSWDGRQTEAAALYRAVLAEDAADGDAQIGLGRALLWDNRLCEGWRTLRNAEAGAAAATSRGAAEVLLTALDEYTPPASIALGSTWDSDDLRITRLGATGTVTIGGNRLLQIMPAHTWYRQPGQPDARALRLGAGIVTALATRWTLHAYGWVDRFDSDGPLTATAAELDWSNGGGDAWLTWLPAPRWRLDFGAGSQAVETYAALGTHLVRQQGSLSIERRLSRRWSAGLLGVAGAYTDENRSDRLTARATWRRDGRWIWQAGPVLSLLDFRVPYPGGYWAPADMRSVGLEATLKTRGHVVTWRLSGSVAREKEAAASAITVGGISGRVGWRFARDWLAGLEGGYAESSLSSASGYHRTSVSLDVRAYF